MVCPDSYVMTADVAGPFRAGRDQDGNGKKYMFVAAYTVPTSEDTPLVKGLRDLGGLPPLEWCDTLRRQSGRGKGPV